MAELRINNKDIFGKFSSIRDEIIVPLNDMDNETIRLFKTWKDQASSFQKVDIVKDVPLTTGMGEKVVLKNAFPIPELADQYVRIKYDYYEIVG